MTAAKIFISYAREDSAVVLPFKDEIERRIAPDICWIDRRIKGYQRFDDEIIDAILQTDVFIFMHSANAQKSEWTRKEIDFASKKKKKIFVVLIDNAPFENWFDFSYDKLQRTKLTDQSDKENLLKDIKSLLFSESVSEPEHPTPSSSKDEVITVKGVAFKMIHVEGCSSGNFHIGETQVTQQLWEAVVGTNPSKFKGSQNPVENFSWNEYEEFISKLNFLSGRQFRLPTEVEWEYAAKGGNKSHGYEYSGSSDINEIAWYSINSGRKTHPVKTKSPNELGIYDMSGNVWEWCNDLYGASSCVIRGGSWYNDASCCRVSDRGWSILTSRGSRLGLRLVF